MTIETSIDLHALQSSETGEAFNLATEVFVRSSTLHRALGISLADYRAYLWPSFQAMVAEGLSVAATEGAGGRLVGCLIASDFAAGNQHTPNMPRTLAPLASLTEALCAIYDDAKHVAPGEAVLIDMAGVAPDAAGGGLYSRMRALAHAQACAHGCRLVIGELSSAATQHVVLNKLGHRNMAEIAFADFAFEGDFPFRSIKDPASLILSEGVL